MKSTPWTLARDERGSVLIIAVIAMLILTVLGVSFALLANIESNIGVNYKSQAQAEAVAESGLDWARDQVRNAGASGTGSGFTKWFDGTLATHMLTSGSGQAVGPFAFKVRIDNDCSTAFSGTPGFPTAIQEGGPSPTVCNNNTDTNETAILTSWAVVGSGRTRARAEIYIDNPWKHVCADSSADGGGLCNTKGAGQKGNPTVVPADTQDPNGPRGYPDLPRPIIGCSRIDPAVHRSDTYCASAASPRLYAQPAVSGYPAYPALGTAPQLVVMAEDPAITTTAKKCNIDPGNASNYYFGYFDCALSTPCTSPACSTTRKACVRETDRRVVVASGYTDLTNYASAGTGWPPVPGCGANTGMVWKNNVTFQGNIQIGTPNAPVVIYMLHDNATPGTGNIPTLSVNTPPSPLIYGTVVSEGNTNAANKVEICTGGFAPSPPPPNPCPSYYTGAAPAPGYGYPLAFLAYDPKLAPPTVSPNAPQPTTTDFGSPNTRINGSVYSGGSVAFNPINVNGSVVAFDINLQATSSTYTYVYQYGNDSPPSGFPPGSANTVLLTPKTFIVCNGYSDDSGGATACQ